MNVARLAGLPAEVVADAAAKSASFERETREAHAIGLARALTRSGAHCNSEFERKTLTSKPNLKPNSN